MNKKIPIIILVCAVVGLVGFSIYKKNQNIVVVKEVSGKVLQANSNSILLEADVQQRKRQIGFNITSSTVFKKTIYVITEAQIRSGKPYTPETREEEGSMSDFLSDPKNQITKVKSDSNLAVVVTASATEVDYLSFALPVLIKN